MPIEATTAAAAATPPDTAASTGGGLDADSLLQLFVAQLKYQTPDNAMSASDMTQQVALMAQMQSTTQMTSALTQLLAQSTRSEANDYIGRAVTWLDANGEEHSGTVTSAAIVNGASVLHTTGSLALTPDQITTITTPGA